MLDVLVVGAGMCGQTAGWNLLREGIRNIRVIDQATYRREDNQRWSITVAHYDLPIRLIDPHSADD